MQRMRLSIGRAGNCARDQLPLFFFRRLVFGFFPLLNYQETVVFERQVSHFITVAIGVAVPVGVSVRDVAEVEALEQQLLAGGFYQFFGAEDAFQDPAVL
jgi:hypothetical protein